jgi:hypothetical protein
MSPELRQAVFALARTTGFSTEEQVALLDSLKRTASRGRTLEQVHARVLARLGPRDFDWPEFDRWQAYFARCRQFPPLWERLHRSPAAEAAREVRDEYLVNKLYLLLDWLQGLATTRAEARAAVARYAKLGVAARFVRQDARIPCPLCDPLNHVDVRATAAGVPPFHPGCRCLVLPTVAPRGASTVRARHLRLVQRPPSGEAPGPPRP